MPRFPMKFDTPHRGLKFLEYYDAHKVYHPGYDLNRGSGNADLGDSIKCPVKGTVEYISPESSAWNRHNGGFGNFIILYHDAYGVWSRYAHCDSIADLKVGDAVGEGARLGTVGNTGTKYAHLHWEVFNDKMYRVQKIKKFRYYPSRKSKQWVSDHYLDPIQWIEDLKKESVPVDSEFVKAWKWGRDNSILSITSKESDTLTYDKFITLLFRYHKKHGKK